jgi:hypothetical protein
MLRGGFILPDKKYVFIKRVELLDRVKFHALVVLLDFVLQAMNYGSLFSTRLTLICELAMIAGFIIKEKFVGKDFGNFKVCFH